MTSISLNNRKCSLSEEDLASGHAKDDANESRRSAEISKAKFDVASSKMSDHSKDFQHHTNTAHAHGDTARLKRLGATGSAIAGVGGLGAAALRKMRRR